MHQINNNIRTPKNNPALPSVNNLSSPNSGYLDKGLFRQGFDTAIRFFKPLRCYECLQSDRHPKLQFLFS